MKDALPGKMSRILVVDDEPRNVNILQEILEDDYSLEVAQDGKTALEKAERFNPDIILLDIMMPGMDGYEVCRHVRSNDKYRNVKIILVSGKSLVEERLKGYEAGADDFIAKPFDIDELFAKVNVFARLKSIEEIDRLKTDFLTLISHETGTPLTHIIGMADFVQSSSNVENDVRDSMQVISTSARSLHAKMQSILYLTRLKQDDSPYDEEINLHELLAVTADSIAEGNAAGSGIKLEIPGSITVPGNYEKLMRMFSNILCYVKSCSKTPPTCTVMLNGGVTIRVNVDIETDDPAIKHFFDPFYVGELLNHHEGLGLDMAIARQIAENHRGTIELECSDKSISCINISLPLLVIK